MSHEIQHDPGQHRFTVSLEHGDAFLSYERLGERTLDFEHTFTPPPHRNQGIARAIVLHALEYARSQGYSVVPSCPYVQRVLEENPRYRDLVVE